MQHPSHAQFRTPAYPANIALPYGDTPQQLVEHYKPLVRKLAWQVHGRSSRTSQLDDLVQIGFMALIEASNSYIDQGYAFVTYATLRIRGSMIDHLRREMTVGRAAVANARKLEAMRQRLAQTLGRRPSDSELADELGIAARDIAVIERQAVAGEIAVLDDCNRELETLADPDQADPETCAIQADLKENLRQMIDGLAEREQLVLQLYFEEELNLQEIGQVMNISSARVCQIKAAALAKLKGAMAFDFDG